MNAPYLKNPAPRRFAGSAFCRYYLAVFPLDFFFGGEGGEGGGGGGGGGLQRQVQVLVHIFDMFRKLTIHTMVERLPTPALSCSIGTACEPAVADRGNFAQTPKDM